MTTIRLFLLVVLLAACSLPTAPRIERTDKTPAVIANYPMIQPEDR